jgi:hypothetical protein
MHVLEIQNFVENKSVNGWGPDMHVRDSPSSGKFALAPPLPKPYCMLRAGGGRLGDKAPLDGKWLDRFRVGGMKKVGEVCERVGEGGQFAEVARSSKADLAGFFMC